MKKLRKQKTSELINSIIVLSAYYSYLPVEERADQAKQLKQVYAELDRRIPVPE